MSGGPHVPPHECPQHGRHSLQSWDLGPTRTNILHQVLLPFRKLPAGGWRATDVFRRHQRHRRTVQQMHRV